VPLLKTCSVKVNGFFVCAITVLDGCVFKFGSAGNSTGLILPIPKLSKLTDRLSEALGGFKVNSINSLNDSTPSPSSMDFKSDLKSFLDTEDTLNLLTVPAI
jgi:hypothetical protein